MKYLNKTFSSRAANEAYREGWEKTFRKELTEDDFSEDEPFDRFAYLRPE